MRSSQRGATILGDWAEDAFESVSRLSPYGSPFAPVRTIATPLPPGAQACPRNLPGKTPSVRGTLRLSPATRRQAILSELLY